MKAVRVKAFGGVDQLELAELPDPEPQPGQVRVRVEACGLNYADVMQREGLYPGGPKPHHAGTKSRPLHHHRRDGPGFAGAAQRHDPGRGAERPVCAEFRPVRGHPDRRPGTRPKVADLLCLCHGRAAYLRQSHHRGAQEVVSRAADGMAAENPCVSVPRHLDYWVQET